MSTLWEGRDIGDVLVEDSVELSRDSLVRYAGASGDFNPIHYRDDVAKSVGLEGVLAHGMLTMGLAVAPVTAWLGDRGFVSSYQVRFTKPVYVPAEGSVTVAVSVSLAKVDEPTAGSATLALSVTTQDGTTVLGKAFVVVSPR
jgi:acyl dehydratase